MYSEDRDCHKSQYFLFLMFPEEKKVLFWIRFFSSVVLEGFGAVLLFLR